MDGRVEALLLIVRPLSLLLNDLLLVRISRTNPVDTWLGPCGSRAVPFGNAAFGTGSGCGKVRINLLALVTSRLRSRLVEEEFWVRRDALEEDGPAL